MLTKVPWETHSRAGLCGSAALRSLENVAGSESARLVSAYLNTCQNPGNSSWLTGSVARLLSHQASSVRSVSGEVCSGAIRLAVIDFSPPAAISRDAIGRGAPG